jgi:hypothetical protein
MSYGMYLIANFLKKKIELHEARIDEAYKRRGELFFELRLSRERLAKSQPEDRAVNQAKAFKAEKDYDDAVKVHLRLKEEAIPLYEEYRKEQDKADEYYIGARSHFSGSLDGLSCFAADQRLRLEDGSDLPAAEILELVQTGQRVVLASTLGPCPVVCAIATHSEGYEITLTDGRSVRLTGSHALPGDPETAREGHVDIREGTVTRRVPWREEPIRWVALGAPTPVTDLLSAHGPQDLPDPSAWEEQQGRRAIRPRDPVEREWARRWVGAGDILGDGVVASVWGLGLIDAVRLYTAHPGWLLTDSGLRVGARGHEITDGWSVATLDECEPGEVQHYIVQRVVVSPASYLQPEDVAHCSIQAGWAAHAMWRTPWHQVVLSEPEAARAAYEQREARFRNPGAALGVEYGENPMRLHRRRGSATAARGAPRQGGVQAPAGEKMAL